MVGYEGDEAEVVRHERRRVEVACRVREQAIVDLEEEPEDIAPVIRLERYCIWNRHGYRKMRWFYMCEMGRAYTLSEKVFGYRLPIDAYTFPHCDEVR